MFKAYRWLILNTVQPGDPAPVEIAVNSQLDPYAARPFGPGLGVGLYALCLVGGVAAWLAYRVWFAVEAEKVAAGA